MFYRFYRSDLGKRLMGLSALFLLLPLLVTLALLLFLETRCRPIMRHAPNGRFQFTTWPNQSRHGPIGLALERSGLNRLPGLFNLVLGQENENGLCELAGLARSREERYRRAI